MQDGSVTVERRKQGPDVWCFRWREGGPDGRKIHRRIVLGTADDLKTIASARKAVVGLTHEINLNDVRIRTGSLAFADLSRHFQQRELVRGNTRIAYSTRKAYEGYLKKWIEPRWGEYRLLEIRAVEVELWLKSLDRAPGTRCKIRNVMSLLFNHARRHDLCDRNPIQWVRQSAKRRTAPDILTNNEVQGLLANLRFRERTLVLLAVTTGLRRSEIFALKWKDVDFHAKQICVTRSIVQNVVGVWLFDAASIYRRRAEDHARAAAPLDNPCDARYVHAGSHEGEADCARSGCHAFVPAKNIRTIKKNGGSASKLCLFCAFLCPRGNGVLSVCSLF